MRACDLDQFEDGEDLLWPFPPEGGTVLGRRDPTDRFNKWEWLDGYPVFGSDPYDGCRFRDD